MENVSERGLATIERIDPQKEIEYGTRAANALIDVVKKAGLSKKLGGDKEHLCFEAWQTVGKFYGATPKVEWTKPIIDSAGIVIGYNSRAVVLQGDRIIGAAEASCQRDEEKWNSRPKYEYHYVKKSGGTSKDDPGKEELVWEKKNGKSLPKKVKVLTGSELVPLFQLESMSQTRAQAKALRSCFAWVVVLAGFAATPAEEMDGVIDAETVETQEEEKTNHNGEPSESIEFITEPQRKRFFAIAKKTGASNEQIKEWLYREYDIESTQNIPKSLYEEICIRVKDDLTEPGE